MSLKDLIIGVALFIGILLVLYVLILVVVNIYLYIKKISHPNTMDLIAAQKTSLRKSLDFKIQMSKEKTSNHEFDSTTTYNNKIKIGTEKLNEYKIKNGTLLSKNRLG